MVEKASERGLGRNTVVVQKDANRENAAATVPPAMEGKGDNGQTVSLLGRLQSAWMIRDC